MPSSAIEGRIHAAQHGGGEGDIAADQAADARQVGIGGVDLGLHLGQQCRARRNGNAADQRVDIELGRRSGAGFGKHWIGSSVARAGSSARQRAAPATDIGAASTR
jgi:hypothetical protein